MSDIENLGGYLNQNQQTLKNILSILLKRAENGEPWAIKTVTQHILHPLIFHVDGEQEFGLEDLDKVEQRLKPTPQEKQFARTVFSLEGGLATEQEVEAMYKIVKHHFCAIDKQTSYKTPNKLVLIENEKKNNP